MFDRLIHLYARGGEPFRSLSDLPDEEALALMRRLYRAGAVYWDRFADPAAYLQAGATVDAAYIEDQIAQRAAAKAAKNYAEADRIRKELLAQGVELKDAAQGTTWTVVQ